MKRLQRQKQYFMLRTQNIKDLTGRIGEEKRAIDNVGGEIAFVSNPIALYHLSQDSEVVIRIYDTMWVETSQRIGMEEQILEKQQLVELTSIRYKQATTQQPERW